MTPYTQLAMTLKFMKLNILGKILPGDKNAVAIVGTRNPSARGKKLAYDFAYYLAGHGVTIVSGLARGIDTQAHKAALEAGGRTIAVIGSGLDNIYPPENNDLAEKIANQGAVVTEFEDGTKPLAKNFLARNRLIAKLSKAVLVIEGKARSGTLSTASHAANLGVEVFAIPGSEATDWLISEGATIANNPKEVLDYLHELNNS